MTAVSDEQLERIARDAGMRVGYMNLKGCKPELVIESGRFPGGTLEDFRSLVRVAYEAGLEDGRAKREEFMRSDFSAAWRDAIAERRRQIEVEGFTHENDDMNAPDECAHAAVCYALGTTLPAVALPAWARSNRPNRDLWPWALRWWKPKNRRYDLIRAIALLVAEVERMDRATERGGK